MEKIKELANEGEGGSVEFKKQLSKDIHLVDNKRQSLAGQMKNRILKGDGRATYVIGVNDNGKIEGLSENKFEETVEVISLISEEVGSEISSVQSEEVGSTGKKVGLVKVSNVEETVDFNNIVIGTAGHVDHGKSTLVSSIVSGREDDGEGKLRTELDNLPHEEERGLSADLSHSVYGFKDEDVVNLDKRTEEEEIVQNCDRIISFVDTVGHRPWISTAIRGLVGQRLDYGLLTVAADEGVTETTREHLGILLAVDLPTIVCITKSDLVADKQIKLVEKEVEKLMRNVGSRSISCSRYGIEETTDEVIKSLTSDNGNINPIIRTSAVNREGIENLNYLIKNLPKVTYEDDNNFKMYIDKVYKVEGVGKVVSGAVKSGEIEKGDNVLIGPDKKGDFKQVQAKSIEMHYNDVESASTGNIIGLSLSDISDINIRRGMVVTDTESPQTSKKFEAEVLVLNHPTSISDGYEPVVHMETVTEVATVNTEESLLAGEKGTVTFEFRFNSYFIEEGQKFIFREGETKGIGTIKEVK